MKHLFAMLLLGAGVTSYGQYDLTIEEFNVGFLGTTYRFYVNAEDPSDKLSAVFGNNEFPLEFNTPDGIYNDALSSSWNASGFNATLISFFPDLAYDSFATIGLEGPAATSGIAGAEDPSLVQDASLSPTVSGYFQTGGTGLNVNTLTGASWYVLNTAANSLPTDGRWLIAQITTTGSLSGTINYQISPLGVGSDQIQRTVSFDDDWGGPCGDLPYPFGCMDPSACNFDPCAIASDDSSCLYLDDSGECIQPILDPVFGCTYVLASNFDEYATEDDGSCVFQPCGDGTIWDDTLNKCVVANPSDTDFDGCVGLNDFLVHLSFYGSGCGSESAWSCGNPLEYQGYDYSTVLIGEQCWFAENLRAEAYANGDEIASQLSEEEWDGTAAGATAVYGDGDLTCYDYAPDLDACGPGQSLSTFGRVYNWHSIADDRGLCPTGWQVPSDWDWSVMEQAIGMAPNEAESSGWRGTNEGSQLKSQLGWSSGNGTDNWSFNGLPAGHRHHSGNYFDAAGNAALFWTATELDSERAWFRILSHSESRIQRTPDFKTYGCSIRCIKDPQ